VVWDPLSLDREPLNLITALHECKIRKEEANKFFKNTSVIVLQVSSDINRDCLPTLSQGFRTLEQSSGSQRPKFRQQLSTFGAQECIVTIF